MEKILLFLASCQIIVENYETILDDKLTEDPNVRRQIEMMGNLSGNLIEDFWEGMKGDSDQEKAFHSIVRTIENLNTKEDV